MSDLDDRIDEDLRATGARWRASREVSDRHLDPALFASPPTRRPATRGFVASLASATAVLTVLLVLAIVKPPLDEPGVLPSSSAGTDAPNPTDVATGPSPIAVVPATGPPGADGVIHMPAGHIKSISLDEIENFQTSGFSSFGSKVVFVSAGDDAKLFLADVDYARLKVLVEAPEHQRILAADISSNHVVWLEGQYATTTGAAPCESQGELTWRLMAFDINTRQSRELAAGVQSRVEFCTAAPPALALDGDLLAYAVEKPRTGQPLAWQVTVISVSTGQVVRTVETELDLFELGLASGNVAYLEGNYDEGSDPFAKTDTRLMLSTPDGQPTQITSDAYDMSFSGARMAWVEDRRLSRHDDSAPRARFMTASVSDLTPREIAVQTGIPPRWPVAGGDVVTWPESGHVILWDPATGVARPLEPTPGADLTNTEGGWLIWFSLDAADGGAAINGIPLASLSLGRPAPQPTPSPVLPSAPVVRNGDMVIGTGVIVAWGGQGPQLCTETPSDLMDSIHRCSPINVDVEVAALEELPGWTPQEGGGFTRGWLTVRGRWIDGALHIDSVTETTERLPYEVPPSPCDEPAGGWPGEPPNTLDTETLGRQLDEVINAEPFQFSGLALARLDASDSGDYVIVIATVGNLQEVRDRLTAMYPYNLCVIPVDYSGAELSQVEDRLFRPEDGTWQTDVDVLAGRVLLKLAVLDEAALAMIGSDIDKVTVRPLIEPAATPD